MKLLHRTCISLLLLFPLGAQDKQPSPPLKPPEGQAPQPKRAPEAKPSDPDAAHNEEARAAAIRQLRRRFSMVATSASGYFHSADSIETNLQADGMSLHPDTLVIRARLERALDQADVAIRNGDFVHALESLDLAEALVSKFAQKLGG
jgi:hypothetical protein